MAFIRRWVAVLPFAGIATLLVHRLLQSPTTGIDDADIFLVYARNLSAGHGRVLLAITVILTLITAASCLGSTGVRRAVNSNDLSLPWACAFLVLLFSDFRFIA